MATSPAAVSDLESRSLRSLSTIELSVAGTLLSDAFDLIVAARPSVETRLDDASTPASFIRLVIQVQCAMVLRVLRNPEGKLEEQLDDYRYRLDQAVSTGALYVSDAEIARLSDGDDVSDMAFTIGPFSGYRHGYWATTDTWVPLAP